MFEVRFSVCPEDCWVCNLSERFPKVAVEVLSINEHIGLAKRTCQDEAELADAFTFAKSHKYVSSLKALHLGEKSLVTRAVCRCPLESRVHKFLPNFGYFYLFPRPIWFLNGLKHYRILVPTLRSFPRFVKEMEERFGNIKLEYKSPVFDIEEFYATPAERILSKLSPRQMEALRKAYFNQYYTYPRKCTLESLAHHMAIEKSTLQSHLRKAENKIIRTLMGCPDSSPNGLWDRFKRGVRKTSSSEEISRW